MSVALDKDKAIIVPAYNASSTIRETLESIQLQQSGLDRVSCIVVADDHSIDDTATVAHSCWKSNVPLVVSRNSENKGERATVNAAVDALPENVDWFFILHADDIAKPNWLEVILRGIDHAPPRTASFTASYDVLFPDGRVEQGENLGEARKVLIEGTPLSIRDTLKRGCWFKISSCAIRVSAFRDVGKFMPNMPQLGDWEFVLRVLRAGLTIEYIPLCLSVYRQTAQGVSSKSFREHRDVKEALVILDQFRDFLPFRDMATRHLYYLRTLARRAGASVVRGDVQRLKTAITVGIHVAASLCNSCLRSSGKRTEGSR
ncbi:MAG TPA: glycosyltransferase family 2 protein [Bryobacteraceae bacterium]|nr:glycosyltransferase family 2 protein [Bryobacteraceae bacterium]